MQSLPAFPASPSTVYSVAIGSVTLRIRLTWRERTASWYIDFYDQAGEPLVLGRRIVVGQKLVSRRVAGMPSGTFVAIGPPVYVREDLGAALRILFIEDRELGALITSPATLPPVVVL